MDQRFRLTFLTRHYYDLQGMRLAPLWIMGMISAFTRFPQNAGLIAGLLAGFFAIQALWFWLSRRYYRTHFGWLKPDPLQFIRRTPLGWLFWLWWAVTVGGLLYCWFQDSSAWAVYWFVFLMSEQAIDSENPRRRRVYYGNGAALVAAAAVLTLLAHWDGRVFVAVTSMTLLGVAIADHALLLQLFAPAQQEVDA